MQNPHRKRVNETSASNDQNQGGQDNNSAPSPGTDSFGYELISTADGSMSVIWADNGNLYAIPEDSMGDVTGSYSDWQFFATEGGVIYGDADGNVLHAYVDTLQQYQVSRLRLGNDTTMPATSVLMCV